MKPEAVFFDLDGTLADTAPDLGGALNRVLQEEGHPCLPIAHIRPYVSQGVRGLLKVGFGLTPDAASYSDLHLRVLKHYEQALCVDSTLFDGISMLLQQLAAASIPWGIVTNKHTRYTTPVVAGLKLDSDAACVISGDTAAAPKPAPDPLLLAASQAGVKTDRCWYVGDDIRDIQAARAAGMRSIAAAYGYLGIDSPPSLWQADAVVTHPDQIFAIVCPTL